jgi:hypothetical protein
MNDLTSTLSQMRIDPIGASGHRSPYTEHRVIQLGEPTASADSHDAGESNEPVVEVGDKVIVCFEDSANRHFVLTVTPNETDLVNGIVSADEPPGQKLIGAAVEEELELDWDGKYRRATILEITKPKQSTREPASTDAAAPSDPRPSRHQSATPETACQHVQINGDPTASELSKYREYEHLMKANGMRCRSLEQWLEDYRARQ